jgi:hypothetical protein
VSHYALNHSPIPVLIVHADGTQRRSAGAARELPSQDPPAEPNGPAIVPA